MIAPEAFEFDIAGATLVYGRGAIDRLETLLAEHGRERALVICGANVGKNRAVMDPVERGLGDRLAGVFDGTTPAKRAEDAYRAIDAMDDVDADALVGVGGGSSLDIARQASALAADGRSLEDLRGEFLTNGHIDPPSGADPSPVVTVPTTFAGADISSGGSIEVFDAASSPTAQPVRTSGRVPPIAVVHDPYLFATTPGAALAGSAMNGFNKGLETIYARTHTPFTDATAVRGLRALVDGLPRLDEPDGLDRAIVGSALVQFEKQTNVLHAFGHAFARRYDVQQGVAHAVVTPTVLDYILGRVDAHRSVLAEGLGLEVDGSTDDEVARQLVASVTELRDGLDVPRRLREIDGVDREEFAALASYIVEDGAMQRAPEGLNPPTEKIEALLAELW